MNKFRFLICISCLLTGLSCCDEVDGLKDLKNTNWELTGLFDEDTGEWIAPEPVECEQGKCYTLAIDEKGVGVLQLVFVSIHIDLQNINIFVMSKIGYDFPGNGNLFYHFLYELDSFKRENNTLMILNESKKRYLQYKLVEL
ncbi:MAG: hypothetical protein LBT76_02075 [Tannerella sp.]|jgi:hypothetical protein|nr:hypothetical protein [Tannerella sp.]